MKKSKGQWTDKFKKKKMKRKKRNTAPLLINVCPASVFSPRRNLGLKHDKGKKKKNIKELTFFVVKTSMRLVVRQILKPKLFFFFLYIL